MKKIIKRSVRFINEDCLKIYLKAFYKWQIKNKFLNKNDTISDSYKQKIKDYWKSYNVNINTNWHKWYSSRNSINDAKYIPEYLYYSVIEPFYNKIEFSDAYADKAFQSKLFQNVKAPITIAKNISGTYYDNNFNIITKDELIRKCISSERVVIKPAIDSGGGRDIIFIDINEVTNMHEEVSNAIDKFTKNYIIQEIIDQHVDLKRINPESINTIRAMSLLLDGEVYVISPRLRMGVNGSRVDNATLGGLSCGINSYGKLNEFAFDNIGNAYDEHPQGFVFKNSSVPSYTKIVEIIKEEHIKLGHFGIISWDFAVDFDGEPLLIEINLKLQGINGGQLCNGPLFGDLTDRVLEQVLGRRK